LASVYVAFKLLCEKKIKRMLTMYADCSCMSLSLKAAVLIQSVTAQNNNNNNP